MASEKFDIRCIAHFQFLLITVWPNKFNILLTASSDPSLYEKYIEYWDDVYGFTMSCMKGEVYQEALVQVVNKDFIVAESSLIKVSNSKPSAIV